MDDITTRVRNMGLVSTATETGLITDLIIFIYQLKTDAETKEHLIHLIENDHVTSYADLYNICLENDYFF